jgi:Xaa-Pro aminopeptidase
VEGNSRVRNLFKISGADAVFLSNREQRDPALIYFTGGVTGTCALVLNKSKTVLIDPESEKIVSPYKRKVKKSTLEDSVKILKSYDVIGVNGPYLSYSLAKFLKKKTKAKIVDVSDKIGEVMAVKDLGEIAKIRNACGIADRAMEIGRGMLKVGVIEADVKKGIDSFLTESGFPDNPLVQFGSNCFYIHNPAQKKKLKKTDSVILDIFPRIGEYYADTTRTYCLSPSEKLKRVWDLVYKAQERAFQNIYPGMKASQAYDLANDIFKKEGVSKAFKHGLGHGVGIAIHEYPSLALKSKHTLRENMVFTIEPGLYYPWGGVRIEDTFLLTKKGCLPLTKSQLELQ